MGIYNTRCPPLFLFRDFLTGDNMYLFKRVCAVTQGSTYRCRNRRTLNAFTFFEAVVVKFDALSNYRDLFKRRSVVKGAITYLSDTGPEIDGFWYRLRSCYQAYRKTLVRGQTSQPYQSQ